MRLVSLIFINVILLLFNVVYSMPSFSLSYPSNNSVLNKESINITYSISNALNLNFTCNFSVNNVLQETKNFTATAQTVLVKFTFNPWVYGEYDLVMTCNHTLGVDSVNTKVYVENHTSDEIFYLIVLYSGIVLVSILFFFYFVPQKFFYILGWLFLFNAIVSLFSFVSLVNPIFEYLNYQKRHSVFLQDVYQATYFMNITLLLTFVIFFVFLIKKLYNVLMKKNTDE